jgi:hypothetical protein
MGAELFYVVCRHTDKLTEGRTEDVTKMIVDFCNSASVP